MIKIYLSRNQFAKLNSNLIEQSIKQYKNDHDIIISLFNNTNNDKICKNLSEKIKNIDVFYENDLLINCFNTNFIPKFKLIKEEQIKNKIKNEYNANFLDFPKNLNDYVVKISGGKNDDLILYELNSELSLNSFKYRYIINQNIKGDMENNETFSEQ